MIFSDKRHLLFLLLILTLAIASRGGSFLWVYHHDPTRIIREDSPTYDLPAQALLHLGRFAINPNQPQIPEVQRTPGYPLYLASVYALFGVHHPPVIILQILLSIGTIGLTYWIGRRLAGPRQALIAAALVSLEPATFLYSQLLLSETLFAFLMAILAVVGIRILSRGQCRLWWDFLLGLLIALTALVRPVNYFFIFPVLLGLIVFRLLRKTPRRLVVGSSLCLFLPWLVLVGGWQWRNQRAIGCPVFSTIQGVNLYLYRGAGIVALRDRISLEAAQQKLLRAVNLPPSTPPAQTYQVFSREGSRLIRAYPLLFLRTQAAGLIQTLFGISGATLREYFGFRAHSATSLAGKVTLAVITLYSLAVLALLYLGIAMIPWRRLAGSRPDLPVHLFLLGIVLYQALLTAGPEANSRFRVPFLPLMAVYSALGLVRILDRLTSRAGAAQDREGK